MSAIEKKMTVEILRSMRERLRSFPPDTSHIRRAEAIHAEFPQFKLQSLADYSSTILSLTDAVFELCAAGKLSITQVIQMARFEGGDQEFLANEVVSRKLGPADISNIKRYVNEGRSFTEAIGLATGEIKPDFHKEKGGRKSLDALLDDITKTGARWRAMVAMAMEMVGEEEAKAGVHMALFEKAYLLRHVIGEQYDFVNSRLNRYVNVIRKRLKGESNGNGARPGAQGFGGEEDAAPEAGSPLQDQPGQDEGEGRQ